MVIIASVLIGLVLAAITFILLNYNKSHQNAKYQNISHMLNGIIIGLVFFCVSFFSWFLLH